MTDFVPIRRALVSVYDKTGLGELVSALAERRVEIVSTGSTAATIRDAGVPVTEVSEVTGFPEVLDGRVKTLHPAVAAGILADRGKPSHVDELERHGIAAFDLVVVNLYPFSQTVANPAVAEADAIEMIDIGGPTLIRAAAKNSAWVAVVTGTDYGDIITRLREEGGTSADARRQLARAAFDTTAAYDRAVSAWMHRDTAYPPIHATAHTKAQDLRYGENPHQSAAYYVGPGAWGIGSARQLAGKELSYNNLLDADAAWGIVGEFSDPCVVIVKHTNPAGVALGPSLADAYPCALAGDPVSAFGGIVAVNRELDADTARQIGEVFTEVVVAPAVSDEALGVLATKTNLRILVVVRPDPPATARTVRSVSGGLLVQDADLAPVDESGWTVPTTAQPDAATLAELRFAWQVARHAKSNAVVLSRDRAVVGVGAGQMSRVDSVRIAVDKSDGRADGSVLASDAFFPFRDGPGAALAAGVRAIVQPGGSRRDDDVVAACDERGVPMVLTGYRHFRH